MQGTRKHHHRVRMTTTYRSSSWEQVLSRYWSRLARIIMAKKMYYCSSRPNEKFRSSRRQGPAEAQYLTRDILFSARSLRNHELRVYRPWKKLCTGSLNQTIPWERSGARVPSPVPTKTIYLSALWNFRSAQWPTVCESGDREDKLKVCVVFGGQCSRPFSHWGWTRSQH